MRNCLYPAHTAHLTLLQKGEVVLALVPTPNPALSDGTFTHSIYQYEIDVAASWIVDDSDPDLLFLHSEANLDVMMVWVESVDSDLYPDTSSYVVDWDVVPFEWAIEFSIDSERVVQASTSGFVQSIEGYEFGVSYRSEDQRFVGLVHWLVIDGILA